MKLLDFFRKTKKLENLGRFSDFFLHAPEKKKEEVFKETAQRANEEQRKVFERSRLKTETI